ncbi:unnamed protein product [Schistosoma curassoni]|uniref:Secreted protein n=1 Tax=Schistosoma curassoni TaxID=6186 RepID=A0A183L5T0_9TREM|nr:unnamed protein product [Schistosoma curassoni]
MFVLKILTLILVESRFESHAVFNCRNAALALPILSFTSTSDPPCSSMMLPRNAALALPILAFTSTSDPPCSSMMLPRYVNDSTSSRVSLSRVIELLFSVLYLGILVFSLCILRPTDTETAATLIVFIFICSCVLDRRAR